jgi:hypothetical protein
MVVADCIVPSESRIDQSTSRLRRSYYCPAVTATPASANVPLAGKVETV